MTDTLPSPEYARNMRLIGHSRSGRPPRRHPGHGSERLCLCRPSVQPGFLNPRRARPEEHPKLAGLRPGAAQYLERPSAGRTTTCCWSSTARMSSPTLPSPTRRATTRPRPAPRSAPPRPRSARDWDAGLAVYDISKAGQPAPHRLHAGLGRHSPHLVHRRPLGLCLGAARRLHRLHLHDGRHVRSRPTRARPVATGCRA